MHIKICKSDPWSVDARSHNDKCVGANASLVELQAKLKNPIKVGICRLLLYFYSNRPTIECKVGLGLFWDFWGHLVASMVNRDSLAFDCNIYFLDKNWLVMNFFIELQFGWFKLHFKAFKVLFQWISNHPEKYFEGKNIPILLKGVCVRSELGYPNLYPLYTRSKMLNSTLHF